MCLVCIDVEPARPLDCVGLLMTPSLRIQYTYSLSSTDCINLSHLTKIVKVEVKVEVELEVDAKVE